MNALETSGYVALALTGITFSALYSGLETGVYTLNRVRLAVRADAAATRLRRELLHPTRTLSTLLVGTNASSYLASYAVAALLHETGMGDWTLIAVEALVLTPLLFVFAETLPKDLFRTYTDLWTYTFSAALTGSRRLFAVTGILPLVHLAGTVTSRLLGAVTEGPVPARRRISQLIKEGVTSGVLTESQTTLADRALALRDRSVASEMVPWSRVTALPARPDRARREAVMRSAFTRVPVVDRAGRVIGVLSTLDAALSPQRSVTDLMTEPLLLHPDTPVREALRQMRSLGRPMAIVAAAPTARPRGLLTIKDLVEPLTGELGAW